MSKVVFREWKPGLKKISFSGLLRAKADLSLKDAKLRVDELLQGKPITLFVRSAQQAQELIDEGAELGAIGAIVSDSQVWTTRTN